MEKEIIHFLKRELDCSEFDAEAFIKEAKKIYPACPFSFGAVCKDFEGNGAQNCFLCKNFKIRVCKKGHDFVTFSCLCKSLVGGQ